MHRARILSLLLTTTVWGAQPTTAAEPSWPRWMVGSWCGQQGETRTQELWLAPDGGLMLGMSRSVSPRSTEFENLRIEWRDGALLYLAQPQGRPAVAFRESQREAQALRFDNPEHDFPKTIRYWREGSRLVAEITGPAGPGGAQRAFRFDYRPCDLEGR